jgi:hypothetical protein
MEGRGRRAEGGGKITHHQNNIINSIIGNKFGVTLLPMFGKRHVEAFFGQHLDSDLRNCIVVLDEEDGGGIGRRGC